MKRTERASTTHVGLLVLVEASSRRVVEREVGQGRGGESRSDEGGGESKHFAKMREGRVSVHGQRVSF